MNAEQLKTMLRSCAENACQEEPGPGMASRRARSFVARLSGALAADDPALSDLLFSMLEPKQDDPA